MTNPLSAADTRHLKTVGDSERVASTLVTDPLDPAPGVPGRIPPLRRVVSRLLLRLDAERFSRPRQILAGLNTPRQFERCLGRVMNTGHGDGIRVSRTAQGFAIDHVANVEQPVAGRTTRLATVPYLR